MSLTVVHAKRMRFRAEPVHVPALSLTFRVNGGQHGPFLSPDGVAGVDAFQVGSAFNIDGSINDLDLDDVRVGTTAYGSSDLFSADFAAVVVPPFDSISTNADGNIVATGGHAHVSGTDDGQTVVAQRDLGALYTTVYVQQKVRLGADMVAAGGQTGDFLDTISGSEGGDVGAGYWFNFETGAWNVYGPSISVAVPFTLVAATWYTVDLKLAIV